MHCESTHLMEDNDNDDNYDNAANDNYDDDDDDDDDDDAEEDSEGELEGRPLLLPLRPCCPVNRRHRVITPSPLQLGTLVYLVHCTMVSPWCNCTCCTMVSPFWQFCNSTSVPVHRSAHHSGTMALYQCTMVIGYATAVHWYRSVHQMLAQFLLISSSDLSLRRK